MLASGEMDEAGFFQNMYDYIAERRTIKRGEGYERRLSICQECEKLLSGMPHIAAATSGAGGDCCGTAPGKSISKEARTADRNNGSLCGEF